MTIKQILCVTVRDADDLISDTRGHGNVVEYQYAYDAWTAKPRVAFKHQGVSVRICNHSQSKELGAEFFVLFTSDSTDLFKTPDTVVGYAQGIWWKAAIVKAQALIINSMWVDKAYRGAGLQLELYKHLASRYWLASDTTQSHQSHATWNKLAKTPGITVRSVDSEFLELKQDSGFEDTALLAGRTSHWPKQLQT